MNPTIRNTLAGLGTALVLTLAVPAAQAENIYKWVDDDGVTQYGSRPPAGKSEEAKLIKGRSRALSRRPGYGPAPMAEGETGAAGSEEEGSAAIPAPAGAKAAEPAAKPETVSKNQELEAESARVEAEVKKINCERAKQAYKVYTENTRVRMKDEETGEDVFVAGPEKEARMKQAQEAIQKNCN